MNRKCKNGLVHFEFSQVRLTQRQSDELDAIIDELQAQMPKTILRAEFAKKGGVISRKFPHYMVVEHSSWLSSWYENSAYIKIPVNEFDLKTVSFTY